MAKEKLTDSKVHKKSKPATSPEAKESICIALAMDLAEQQLRDGTASSQLITEFVKRGSRRYESENEKLREEVNQLKAKTEALKSAKNTEELYAKAIKAMRSYIGDYEDDYDEY